MSNTNSTDAVVTWLLSTPAGRAYVFELANQAGNVSARMPGSPYRNTLAIMLAAFALHLGEDVLGRSPAIVRLVLTKEVDWLSVAARVEALSLAWDDETQDVAA
jgi:hypothetical protein